LRCGFFTSAAANVTLFHASLEKSDPTSAAPKASTSAESSGIDPTNWPGPKLAAIASGFRPIVRPSRTSAASAPVLTTVNVVWTILPSRTPRRLIHVKTHMETSATRRWGESPASTAPTEMAKSSRGNQAKRSGPIDGTRTPRNRPNATATAAIVPVWMTRKRVHP
jgi:hypothetical protein